MLFLNVLSMPSGWIVLQTVNTYFGTSHLTKDDRVNGNKVLSLGCILVRGQRLRYAFAAHR